MEYYLKDLFLRVNAGQVDVVMKVCAVDDKGLLRGRSGKPWAWEGKPVHLVYEDLGRCIPCNEEELDARVEAASDALNAHPAVRAALEANAEKGGVWLDNAVHVAADKVPEWVALRSWYWEEWKKRNGDQHRRNWEAVRQERNWR